MLHDETAAHTKTKARLKDANAQIAFLMGLTPSPEIDTGSFTPDAPDGTNGERHLI